MERKVRPDSWAAEVDRLPRIIESERPTYPPDMRRRGKEATVTIEFLVDEAGLVAAAYPTDTDSASAPPLAFQAAAMVAVWHWRFEPAMKGGRAVAVRMRVPVIFALQEEPAAAAPPTTTSAVGSPAWMVETFFTQPTLPTPEKYYTGEMLRYLKSPPMGAYVPPGYSRQVDLLAESADAKFYRFTYSHTPKAADWYVFLVRDGQDWKLSAVRTLAIPPFFREVRDRVKAQVNRDAKEEADLQKMDLVLSSDSELKAYFKTHASALNAIAKRVLAGEGAAQLGSELGAAKMEAAVLVKQGWVQLTIGGVTDNTVGFIFVPTGKAAPKMGPEEFILVEPIGEHWFLFKTT